MKMRLILLAMVVGLVGCQSARQAPVTHVPESGEQVARQGDEIVVCGNYFHIGTPVVLWTDPGGYDAYRTERRFSPFAKSSWAETQKDKTDVESPNRYGIRQSVLNAQEFEEIRGGGWPLPLLQDRVDQFIIHYDVAGVSRECFKTLQDIRGLSVHFMLDIDGTIYQTLDLKERAWHASEQNSRSIGVEIANVGAYPLDSSSPILKQWYRRLPDGRTRITLPAGLDSGGVRKPAFVGYPIRNDPVYGTVQGGKYRQYDFTPEQYQALIKLTAALCTIFPKITCDYPRQRAELGAPTTAPTTQMTASDPAAEVSALAGPDEAGFLIPHVLSKAQINAFHGVLGHYHVSAEKQDPGPAFQWDYVINGARQEMRAGR